MPKQFLRKGNGKLAYKQQGGKKLGGRLLSGSSSLRHKCCAIFSYHLWFNSTPSFSSPLKAVGSATAPCEDSISLQLQQRLI